MTKIVGDSGVSITRYICGRCGSRWATAEPCPLCKVAVQALSASEAGDDPLVGRSLANRYQIMARIGRGSIGAIFRAIDQTTERQVAVKVLKKHLVRDEELRARFDQEAQALKRMQHKNLIAVRDCGITTSGEEPFIVMEYVDGETLASVLGDLTYIAAERLVPIMVQVCDALIHAHSQGILHRDIKPANIMLIDLPRERDVVKVLDFGLAKIADDAFASSSTAPFETNPGDPIGTPLYMSPEQARGEKLDARTDIYSIGAVFYECLTGVPPISGTGVIEILKKQVSYTPPAMSSVRPFLQIPSELEEIVSKCMQKERSERYNNMFELKEAYVSSSQMQAVTPSQTKEPSLWDKVMNALKGKK
jgi:eukaryotic-like serine/threonine-protein kinase